MNRAKSAGGKRRSSSTAAADDARATRKRFELGERLAHSGSSQKADRLHYQPQVNVQTGRILPRLEALMTPGKTSAARL